MPRQTNSSKKRIVSAFLVQYWRLTALSGTWESMSELEQHFQVADSGTFVTQLGKLAAIAPEMKLYESDEIKRH